MKSLVPSVLIVASLAFSANAFAADSHVKANTAAVHAIHARTATHVVAKHSAPRQHYATAPRPLDIGQIIQSFFGSGFAVQAARGSAGTDDWSPSYDTSSTVDTTSSSNDAQAAADTAAENAAIQSMNDTNALNASMAAAEQQNDAANAATLQTEINAGM
jgi:hypothetical protein